LGVVLDKVLVVVVDPKEVSNTLLCHWWHFVFYGFDFCWANPHFPLSDHYPKKLDVCLLKLAFLQLIEQMVGA
jgi:hypothetical protein